MFSFSLSNYFDNSNGATNLVDNVNLQLQDESGNWRTYVVTINNSHVIASNMRTLQDMHPGMKGRAVDSSGRIVDIF
jgi:hypothetical protein